MAEKYKVIPLSLCEEFDEFLKGKDIKKKQKIEGDKNEKNSNALKTNKLWMDFETFMSSELK